MGFQGQSMLLLLGLMGFLSVVQLWPDAAVRLLSHQYSLMQTLILTA